MKTLRLDKPLYSIWNDGELIASFGTREEAIDALRRTCDYGPITCVQEHDFAPIYVIATDWLEMQSDVGITIPPDRYPFRIERVTEIPDPMDNDIEPLFPGS